MGEIFKTTTIIWEISGGERLKKERGRGI